MHYMSRVKNKMHALLCYQLWHMPLPLIKTKKLRRRLKLARERLLSLRSARHECAKPRQHVIHQFNPKDKPRAKVLVTHGWTSQSLFMVQMIGALIDDGLQVYAIDFPAHGESKGLSIHWRDSVDIILEAVEQMGPFDAVIGHSYGGAMLLTAQAIFCQNNPLAKRIVLIAAPTRMTTPMKNIARKLKLSPQSYRIFKRLITQDVDQDIKQVNLKLNAVEGPCQYLAIHGKRDTTIKPWESVYFCQNNPNAKLALFDTLGHTNILFDRHVYQTIIDFI